MSPDAPEPPSVGPAQQPVADLAEASAAGFGVAHAGAPLRWPHTERRECSPSLRRDSEDESSAEEEESSDESESSRVHRGDQRGHVEDGNAASCSMSDASSHTGSECSMEDTE